MPRLTDEELSRVRYPSFLAMYWLLVAPVVVIATVLGETAMLMWLPASWMPIRVIVCAAVGYPSGVIGGRLALRILLRRRAP